MNRAERPCYKCQEMPPWKLHIMPKGRAVRCSSFKRLQAFNCVWWYWGRKGEIKGTSQKKSVGRGCGENEKGWNKTHTKSPPPCGTDEARRTGWREILRPRSPACAWIPDGDHLLPFWSAGWGGTCGYLEGFLIWKFTLSSSTFRLMEAAESLSTVDWKLLTDVRLLGLAEAFSVGGREKKYRERRGVKTGFIRVLEERRKMFF